MICRELSVLRWDPSTWWKGHSAEPMPGSSRRPAPPPPRMAGLCWSWDQRTPGGEIRRPFVSVCLPGAESINKNHGLHKSTWLSTRTLHTLESKSPLESKLLRGIRSKKPSLKSLLKCLSVLTGSSEKAMRNSVCKYSVWLSAEENPNWGPVVIYPQTFVLPPPPPASLGPQIGRNSFC